MHTDLIKLLGSVLGFIISWKLIFWLFSPSELSAIIMVNVLLFFAYGIKLVEWSEESSWSFFGVSAYRSKKINRQYKIFGFMPISSIYTIKFHRGILDDHAPKDFLPLAKMALNLLPFFGYLPF